MDDQHPQQEQQDEGETAGSVLDPAKMAAAKRARSLRQMLARQDPNWFCHYVLRDERTAQPIKQAPMHETWQRLCSKHDRLLIWSHVEGGKTNQIALGRSLFELGKDPSLKIAIISNTNELAKKITRQLGQYIEKSRELHEVFPNLVPTDDPNLQWRAQALTVKRPGMGAKDPSIQACGMHGNIIGSRIDLLILDDVLDFENTHTPGPRDDAYRWLKYIMGRMTEGGRIWCVGNAWHPDDPMHRLEKDGFAAYRFPVILPDGSLTWPEKWSLERIERARGADGFGPLEFARQLMCQARDDTSSRFKREWIEVCERAGEGLGYCEDIEALFDELHPIATDEQIEEVRAANETMWRLTGRSQIITGVDLAVQRGDSNDETVLFTIYVDEKQNRRVLNVRAGKWTGPEIIRQICDVYDKFGSLFIVENNAAQDFIRQFVVADTAIPIIPFTTGRNKASPEFGVESLAAEMANGKWQIPNRKRLADGSFEPMHKEVAEWVRELLFYDPKEHTGDRLMASWFAREGARRFCGRGGAGTVNVRVL